MIQTSRKRRACLLFCARQGFNIEKTNEALKSSALNIISPEDWILWTEYYEPLIAKCTSLEAELIENNRSLSWIVRELNSRYKKQRLS